MWSFSRGGFDLDLFCHFPANETPKMRLPSLFTLDLFCYDTRVAVAIQQPFLFAFTNILNSILIID